MEHELGDSEPIAPDASDTLDVPTNTSTTSTTSTVAHTTVIMDEIEIEQAHNMMPSLLRHVPSEDFGASLQPPPPPEDDVVVESRLSLQAPLGDDEEEEGGGVDTSVDQSLLDNLCQETDEVVVPEEHSIADED